MAARPRLGRGQETRGVSKTHGDTVASPTEVPKKVCFCYSVGQERYKFKSGAHEKG